MSKRIIYIIGLFIFITGLISCDKQENPEDPSEQQDVNGYILTANVSPNGSGSIDIAPDKTSYDTGDSVFLTAIAEPGYTFTGWSGALSGTDNPTNLVMDSDKAVLANFSSGGSSSSASSSSISSPSSSTSSSSLSSSSSSSSSSTSPPSYTINTIVAPSSNAGSVAKVPDLSSYSPGASVFLVAIEEPGYSFDGWLGDLSGSLNPISITMSSNLTAVAVFSPVSSSSSSASTSSSSTSTSGASTTSSASTSTSTSSGSTSTSGSTSSCGGCGDGYLTVVVSSTAAVWNNEQFSAAVTIPNATGYSNFEFDYKVTGGSDGLFSFFIQDSGMNNSVDVLYPSSITYDGGVYTAAVSAATLFSTIDESAITQVWFIIANAGQIPSSDLTVQIDNLRFTGGGADIIIYDGSTDNLGPIWDTSPNISITKVGSGEL